MKRKLSDEDGGEDPEDKRSKGKATWRKYGQKTLKGKEYVGMRVLRCYYRCNFPGCTVRRSIHSNRLYPTIAIVKIIPLVVTQWKPASPFIAHGFQVKKQVETSAWSNEPANITIHGIHNHQVEENLPLEAAVNTSDLLP